MKLTECRMCKMLEERGEHVSKRQEQIHLAMHRRKRALPKNYKRKEAK